MPRKSMALLYKKERDFNGVASEHPHLPMGLQSHGARSALAPFMNIGS